MASDAPDLFHLLLTPIKEQTCSVLLGIIRDNLLNVIPLCVEMVVTWGYGCEVLLGEHSCVLLVHVLRLRSYTSQARVHRAISLKTRDGQSVPRSVGQASSL